MTMLTNMNRRVDPKSLPQGQWSVADAKARFSEVVARATAGEPQHVTRYGKDEVVIVSAKDWAERASPPPRSPKKGKPGTLLELFAPLAGSGVIFERIGGGVRSPLFGEDD